MVQAVNVDDCSKNFKKPPYATHVAAIAITALVSEKNDVCAKTTWTADARGLAGYDAGDYDATFDWTSAATPSRIRGCCSGAPRIVRPWGTLGLS